MSIVVTQNVKQINITVTQDGNTVQLQPVICKASETWDGIVNGGTP